MKLCRFLTSQRETRVGLLTAEKHILDLSDAGVNNLTFLLETKDALEQLETLSQQRPARFPLNQIQLLSPIERQEVWAAGVTYLRSKKARMEESRFSANAYDRAYSAPRPEIFFKSLPEKVVGPGEPVGIRKDAQCNVPEPELALVVNSRGTIVGYTIANDMSSRDIEGGKPALPVSSQNLSLLLRGRAVDCGWLHRDGGTDLDHYSTNLSWR